MKTFTYPFFWKIVYRYGNLIISPLLLIYCFSVLSLIDNNILYLLPFIISLIILYSLNKYYFDFYKIIPYKIEADEEKLVCSQFLFRNKTLTVYIKDIEKLSGGIFNGRFRGVMKICDGKNKICIGFFDRINKSSTLITLILSRVDKKIYDDVIENIKSLKIRPDIKK